MKVPSKEQNHPTIITLNCWGGELASDLVEWLKVITSEQEIDIICLQEIYSLETENSHLPVNDMYWGKQVQLNLFEYLCTQLDEYTGFFIPSRYIADTEGDKNHKTKAGIATFVKNGIKITQHHTPFIWRKFNQTKVRPTPRTLSCIRIEKDDCTPLVVAHFHGIWRKEGKDDTPEIITQANNIVKEINTVLQPGDNLIICGDFNVLPESRTFTIFDDAFDIKDLVVRHGFTTTRSCVYAGSVNYADYMCVSTDLVACSFEVVISPIVSDHCPLILTNNH